MNAGDRPKPRRKRRPYLWLVVAAVVCILVIGGCLAWRAVVARSEGINNEYRGEGLLAELADWALYGDPPGGIPQVTLVPTGPRQVKDALARAESAAGFPVRVPSKLAGRDLKVRSVEFMPSRTTRGLIGRSIHPGSVEVALDDGLPGSYISLSMGEGFVPVHEYEPAAVYLSGGAVSGLLSECKVTLYPGGGLRPTPKPTGWRLTWDHDGVSFDLTWERLEGRVPDREEASKALTAAAEETTGG